MKILASSLPSETCQGIANVPILKWLLETSPWLGHLLESVSCPTRAATTGTLE